MPGELQHLFGVIREEYELTLTDIRLLTGELELLDHQPVLKRSLAVRDQYLEPVSYLQVDLPRRVQAEAHSGQPDGQPQQAMLITINDVAMGMPDTR